MICIISLDYPLKRILAEIYQFNWAEISFNWSPIHSWLSSFVSWDLKYFYRYSLSLPDLVSSKLVHTALRKIIQCFTILYNTVILSFDILNNLYLVFKVCYTGILSFIRTNCIYLLRVGMEIQIIWQYTLCITWKMKWNEMKWIYCILDIGFCLILESS